MKRFFAALVSAWLCAFCLAASGQAGVAGSAATTGSGQIYLYRSDANNKYYASAGGDYARLIIPWQQFFSRTGTAYKELSTGGLGALKRNDVLILPSALVLSTTERDQIAKAAQSGVNLLATWAGGARDESGQWLGYTWLKQTFGIDVVADIRSDGGERFLLPYGESPINSKLASGKRIFLGATVEPLLRATARYPVARFGNWQRSSHLPNANAAAIAIDEIAGSRRAWFGMAENSWDLARSDIDALLADTLNWLQRKPIASLAAWPAPYQSAFFVEMDTEDRFENAATLEKLFNDRGLRGTFYMLTSLALKQPDLVKRIATRHEVGYHADVHDGFKGQPVDVQEGRIQKMVADLKTILGEVSRAKGFRAPLESYDVNTEKALRKFGFRHHTADSGSTDSSLPGFSTAEPGLNTEEALVVIPRTLLDDINYVQMGLLTPGAVRSTLVDNLRDKLALRGLGLLSVHTQNFQPGSVLDKELPIIMDEALRLKDRIWMPAGDQIERWWRDRARLTVKAETQGTTMRVKIDNAAPRDIRNAQIIVTAPQLGSQPKIAAPLASSDIRLDKQDDFRWSLSVPLVKAASSVVVNITFQ